MFPVTIRGARRSRELLILSTTFFVLAAAFSGILYLYSNNTFQLFLLQHPSLDPNEMSDYLFIAAFPLLFSALYVQTRALFSIMSKVGALAYRAKKATFAERKEEETPGIFGSEMLIEPEATGREKMLSVSVR